MTSQITGVSIVCSAVCSGANQRKHQSSVSLVFVRGIHRSSDSSAENVSIWWCHHGAGWYLLSPCDVLKTSIWNAISLGIFPYLLLIWCLLILYLSFEGNALLPNWRQAITGNNADTIDWNYHQAFIYLIIMAHGHNSTLWRAKKIYGRIFCVFEFRITPMRYLYIPLGFNIITFVLLDDMKEFTCQSIIHLGNRKLFLKPNLVISPLTITYF